MFVGAWWVCSKELLVTNMLDVYRVSLFLKALHIECIMQVVSSVSLFHTSSCK